MEQLNSMIMLSDGSIGYYVIDFVIMLGFMAALRLIASSIAGTSLAEILARRDNFAAGITLAGAVIAVSILMMGVVAGEAGRSYIDEISLMAAYGVLAGALMGVTRKIFDHIALPSVSIHAEILRGNLAAGVVDAGNMISTAVMVRAAMSWIDGSSFLGLVVVLVIYLFSQLLLLGATLYRKKVFEIRHQQNYNQNGDNSDKTLASEIANGNVALALRFAGHRLGVGLAVPATSGMVIYDPALLLWSLLAWSVVAVMMFLAQTGFSIVLRQILLPGINIGQEVGEQRNIAIGSIEAAIYIGVGFTFVGLLG